MKRTIIILSRNAASVFILWAAVCGGLQAQEKDSIDVSQFVVTYDYAVKTKMGKNDSAFVDSCRIALLVGSSHTMQMKYYQYVWMLLGDHSVGDKLENSCTFHFPEIYTGLSDGKMTMGEYLPPYRYLMEEPMNALQWTLSEDTTTVMGYACKTASCKYGGRTWTVCYTEEIPSTAGPWKLHGLPGLIVKASDGDGIHTFQLHSLEQKAVTMATYFQPNSDPWSGAPADIRISPKKFINQRNKLLCDKRYTKNPAYYLLVDNADLITKGGFTYIFWGGMSYDVTRIIPTAENVRYYQPLELK